MSFYFFQETVVVGGEIDDDNLPKTSTTRDVSWKRKQTFDVVSEDDDSVTVTVKSDDTASQQISYSKFALLAWWRTVIPTL